MHGSEDGSQCPGLYEQEQIQGIGYPPLLRNQILKSDGLLGGKDPEEELTSDTVLNIQPWSA